MTFLILMKMAGSISGSGERKGEKEASKETGARNNHWCEVMIVSRGANGTGSWWAASSGCDGVFIRIRLIRSGLIA
jgi:hypothetical protein